jgi:hypothetical protein
MPEGWGVPKINGPSRPEAEGPLLKEHPALRVLPNVKNFKINEDISKFLKCPLANLFKSWCLPLHKAKIAEFFTLSDGHGNLEI